MKSAKFRPLARKLIDELDGIAERCATVNGVGTETSETMQHAANAIDAAMRLIALAHMSCDGKEHTP